MVYILELQEHFALSVAHIDMGQSPGFIRSNMEPGMLKSGSSPFFSGISSSIVTCNTEVMYFLPPLLRCTYGFQRPSNADSGNGFEGRKTYY